MTYAQTVNLSGAIILGDLNEGALHGEPADDLQRAIDAGILYVCLIDDGTCPNGVHKGGPFLHYAKGKTYDDYERLVL